jgi:hypothetical protein
MPLPFPFTVYGASRSSAPSDDCFTYCYGGDWVQGKVGNYGVSFNGSDEYILSDAIGSQYTNKITFAAWVKPGAIGSNMVIGSEYRYTSANQRGWAVRINTSGKIDVFATSDGSWTSGQNISLTGTGTALSAGTWAHVAVVIDAATPTAKIYINGSLDQSGGGTGAGFNIYDSPVGYTLAGYWSGASQVEPFNGSLDEPAMWNVELTSTEIAALYNSGAGARADSITPPNVSVGVTGSLLVYYDFEIGNNNPVSGNFPTSRTVYDVVTASFHGGAAHTGTMNSNMDVADFGEWDQGKMGKYSLHFPASSDDRVSIPLGALTGSSNGQSGSISAWIYRDVEGSYPEIITTSKSGVTTDYFSLAIYTFPGADVNKLQLEVKENTVTVGRYLSADTIPLTTWTHVAATSDGTNVKLYINGERNATSVAAGADGKWVAAANAGGDLNVALLGNLDYAGGINLPLAGKLDEVSVWDGPLSNANISSLHSGSKANAITPATYVTGSWTPGKIGDYSIGLNQEGISRVAANAEGITAPSSSALPLGATVSSAGDGPAFSVSAWINPTVLAGSGNTGAIWRFIVGRDGAGATGYNGWKISMDGADGELGMISWAPGGYPSSGYNGRVRSSTGAIEINKWHLVVGIWDPADSGNEVKLWIYKDGAASTLLQTSYSSLSFTPGPGDEKLGIGAYDYLEGGYLTQGWMGKIDDVGIWDVALDSGSVYNLWNTGTGAAATTVSGANLVANYTMDSTYGTTTIVDGVAGNNGTLSNATMPLEIPTLISYYDMECDGPGSATVKDQSGNSYDGTMTNMPTGSCGSG